jgi:hypothetical protein
VSGPIESISYDPEKKAMVVGSRFSTDDSWTEVVNGVEVAYPKNGLLDQANALGMEKNFKTTDSFRRKGCKGLTDLEAKRFLVCARVCGRLSTCICSNRGG